MLIGNSHIVMSDGTAYYVNGCIVGISVRDGMIYGGYDQMLDAPEGWKYVEDWPGLPGKHRREIAFEMICVWVKFFFGWGGAYPKFFGLPTKD